MRETQRGSAPGDPRAGCQARARAPQRLRRTLEVAGSQCPTAPVDGLALGDLDVREEAAQLRDELQKEETEEKGDRAEP